MKPIQLKLTDAERQKAIEKGWMKEAKTLPLSVSEAFSHADYMRKWRVKKNKKFTSCGKPVTNLG